VDAGDVLGLFIEGVLGDRNSIPPIINLPYSPGNCLAPTRSRASAA
jgi:hypothetical protein